LKTVKDWIHADFETWDKIIKKEDDERYIINVSGEDMKNRHSKRIKK
jgi:SOS-response transcriptional repressor LexA